MVGQRRSGLAACRLAGLLFVAIRAAADPAAHPQASAAAQEPEGLVSNADGTYTLHRLPTRSLDTIMQSFSRWRLQVLAGNATAEYSVNDGVLSMQCSACGLSSPSAIDIATVDFDTMIAYEAGVWHLSIRSRDGTRDFFGVLRGEVGPEPRDPARVSEDRHVALKALEDLYDLAYLTQKSAPVPAARASSASGVSTAVVPPHPAPTAGALSLENLVAAGDVEAIQGQPHVNARDLARALEAAYCVRARSQVLEANVDAALQTLSFARQKFGKSVALRDREAHYVVVGDAYDRLRLAVDLEAAEIQPYLQQIRLLEPQDATAIERMLARTLSNRIADQRAAGRQIIAEGLTNTGRELFPSWVELLGHGTSGVLPSTGVEVGTVATPPAGRDP